MQVYPASAGDRLGFTQVVEKLDSLLISEPGRDRLGNMRPAADVGWLRSELSRVDALQRVLRFDDPVPFEPMPDVRPQLRRAAPEDAYLDPLPLYEVGQFLGTARRLHEIGRASCRGRGAAAGGRARVVGGWWEVATVGE